MNRKKSKFCLAHKVLAWGLLIAVISSFVVLASGCSSAKVKCSKCNEKLPSNYTYCYACGAKIGNNDESDAKALLGTWETNNHFGRYTYSFYADGSCKGEYWGNTGGVMPSLYPDSYYVGAGDGTWSFTEGDLITLLKVSYRGRISGDHAGVQQYEYEFNEDKTELTIYGVATYGNGERGSIVWKKISD